MAAERNLELLDDYLANRMDEKARSAFEKQMASDPALKAEFQLQQQYINAIRKARVAELKAMLNNVLVPAPVSGSTVATKVALWTAGAAIVGTGLYFYLRPSSEHTEITDIKTGQTERVPTDSATEQPGQQEEHPHEVSSVDSEEEASSEQTPVESPKAAKKNNARKEEYTADRKLDVFDPTKEDSSNQPAQAEPQAPALQPATSVEITVEIDATHKKYNFHYQFKEGKLFLYGPFESNLYEIMEFFSGEKRTLFLYHKDNYYLLKEDNQKPKPLTAIQDPILLKKLKEYRN